MLEVIDDFQITFSGGFAIYVLMCTGLMTLMALVEIAYRFSNLLRKR